MTTSYNQRIITVGNRRLGVRVPSGARHQRRLACGNAGRAPFRVRPLWTPGAPTVLVCFGIVCAAIRGGVLLRADPYGAPSDRQWTPMPNEAIFITPWPTPRWTPAPYGRIAVADRPTVSGAATIDGRAPRRWQP